MNENPEMLIPNNKKYIKIFIIYFIVISSVLMAGLILLLNKPKLSLHPTNVNQLDKLTSYSPTAGNTIFEYQGTLGNIFLCGDRKLGYKDQENTQIDELDEKTYQEFITILNSGLESSDNNNSFNFNRQNEYLLASSLGMPLPQPCRTDIIYYFQKNEKRQFRIQVECEAPTVDFNNDKRQKEIYQKVSALQHWILQRRNFGFLILQKKMKTYSWEKGDLLQYTQSKKLSGEDYLEMWEQYTFPYLFRHDGNYYEIDWKIDLDGQSKIIQKDEKALRKFYDIDFKKINPLEWKQEKLGAFHDGTYLSGEAYRKTMKIIQSDTYIMDPKTRYDDFPILYKLTIDHSLNFSIDFNGSFCPTVVGKTIEQFAQKEYKKVYEISDTLWEKFTSLPEDRFYHAATMGNGYVFVSGGLTNIEKNFSSGTSEYNKKIIAAKVNADGTLGEWREVGKFTDDLMRHAMEVAGDRLYFSGGFLYPRRAENALDQSHRRTVFSAKILDRGELTDWRKEEPLPKGSMGHSMQRWNDLLYVFGGATDGYDGHNSIFWTRIGREGELEKWKEFEIGITPSFGGGGIIEGRLFLTNGNELISYNILPDGNLSDVRPEVIPPISRREISKAILIRKLGENAIFIDESGNHYLGTFTTEGRVNNWKPTGRHAETGGFSIASSEKNNIYIIGGFSERSGSLQKVVEVWGYNPEFSVVSPNKFEKVDLEDYEKFQDIHIFEKDGKLGHIIFFIGARSIWHDDYSTTEYDILTFEADKNGVGDISGVKKLLSLYESPCMNVKRINDEHYISFRTGYGKFFEQNVISISSSGIKKYKVDAEGKLLGNDVVHLVGLSCKEAEKIKTIPGDIIQSSINSLSGSVVIEGEKIKIINWAKVTESVN